MGEITIDTAAPEDVVWAVVTHLNKGQIEDATSCFARQFTFRDYGIGLEFSEKQRLTEFFQKRRELHPDAVVQTERVFVRDDHSITEWTLQGTVTASLPRTLLEDSYRRARRLHPKDRSREDYGLVELL